jgi:hypothetical protein
MPKKRLHAGDNPNTACQRAVKKGLDSEVAERSTNNAGDGTQFPAALQFRQDRSDQNI